MNQELLQRAAEARAAGTRSVNDRPRERRASGEPGGLWASRAVTRRPVEVREAAEPGALSFVGYASVTETPYEMYDFFGPFTEVVSRGAFAETLNQADLDVPLVLNHESIRRIARTTNGSLLLSEDETGLLCDAPNLDPTDADVAYIAPKLRSGLCDEMSFRFTITAGQWSPDYTEFRINAVDIQRGDVSIVGYGASPHTSGQLRAAVATLESIERSGGPLSTPDARVAKVEVVRQSLSELDLTNATAAEIRTVERLLRREMAGREMTPSMSLQDLLSA